MLVQRNGAHVKVVMTTNDAVVISLAEALLRDSGIGHLLLDQHMSVLEGSIGILPRRLAVSDEEHIRARRLLRDAGLGEYLVNEPVS